MKTAIFYDHIKEISEKSGKDIRYFLCNVHNIGIEAVDINFDYLLKNDVAYQNILDSDMKISNIYSFYEWNKNSDELRIIKNIDVASEMHVSNIMVIPGFISFDKIKKINEFSNDYEELKYEMDACEEIQKMITALKFMVEHAATKNITVTLENFDNILAPYSKKLQLRYFFEKVKDLRLCLDTGNSVVVGEDVIDLFNMFRKNIVHVHCKDRIVKDNSYKTCSVNCGNMPIKYIINELFKDDFDGYFVIEHYDVEDQYKSVIKSINFFNEIRSAKEEKNE